MTVPVKNKKNRCSVNMNKILHFAYVIFIFLLADKVFSDVVISSAEEAAQFAVSHSKSQHLQRLSLETSAKSSRLAVTDFLPKLDLSWTEDDSVKIGGADSRSKSISANVTQMVFDGGKAKITYDMNRAESFYNLKVYETELNAFRSNVINSYYAVIQLQKQVVIQEKLEENARIQLEIIQKELELGLALENDCLEMLIQYRKIQDDVKKYKRELRTKERNFKVLLGLDAESQIMVTESVFEEESVPYLEKYVDLLWQILKNNNPALKKSQTALYYAQQQYNYSNRLYFPNVSVNCGLSFSGTQYPLSNPSVNAKIIINFDNNPLFPFSYQSGFGFNKKKLTSLSNSSSLSLSAQPGYFLGKKAEKIQLSAKSESLKDEELSLYEQLFDKIASHDDCIDSIERGKETIRLQTRRLEVSREQVSKGLMKKIDYLELMEQLAGQETALMQSEISRKSLVREIEIFLCIPFGGLKKCLKD